MCITPSVAPEPLGMPRGTESRPTILPSTVPKAMAPSQVALNLSPFVIPRLQDTIMFQQRQLQEAKCFRDNISKLLLRYAGQVERNGLVQESMSALDANSNKDILWYLSSLLHGSSIATQKARRYEKDAHVRIEDLMRQLRVEHARVEELQQQLVINVQLLKEQQVAAGVAMDQALALGVQDSHCDEVAEATIAQLLEQMKTQQARVEALEQEVKMKDQLLEAQQAAADIAMQQAVAREVKLTMQLSREADIASKEVQAVPTAIASEIVAVADDAKLESKEYIAQLERFEREMVAQFTAQEDRKVIIAQAAKTQPAVKVASPKMPSKEKEKKKEKAKAEEVAVPLAVVRASEVPKAKAATALADNKAELAWLSSASDKGQAGGGITHCLGGGFVLGSNTGSQPHVAGKKPTRKTAPHTGGASGHASAVAAATAAAALFFPSFPQPTLATGMARPSQQPSAGNTARAHTPTQTQPAVDALAHQNAPAAQAVAAAPPPPSLAAQPPHHRPTPVPTHTLKNKSLKQDQLELLQDMMMFNEVDNVRKVKTLPKGKTCRKLLESVGICTCCRLYKAHKDEVFRCRGSKTGCP